MRIYYLAGVLLSVTTILSACGESVPTECTITSASDARSGVIKTAKFAAGTDCEAMRKLAEEGKPLPTIGEANTKTAQKPVAPPATAFSAPLVAGKSTEDLIPTTDKKARVDELEKKMGISSEQPNNTLIKNPKGAVIPTVVDSKQLRDPFTSTIINPVPKLEDLLEKPQIVPNLRAAVVVRTSNKSKFIAPPPDIKAAQGTKVTGTIEVLGTIYAIIQSPDEPTSRNVQAGQMISNGKVLVKRIDTNAEPPIVVLQQSGVEVLRAVGEPPVGTVDPTATATTTTTTQATTAPLPPAFILPSN
ncbi:MAG: hypothetical protein WCQ26_13565 [Pseudanabaena sp. ELA748]